MTSRSGGRPSICAHLRCVASRRRQRVAGGKPRGERQRRDQADGSARAGAGDVEGRAVVGRGAHERQAERHVDRVVEGQRLDRDQRLVVIHAERRVVGRARRCVEHGVGRQRPARVDALGRAAARPPARRCARPRRRSRRSSPACGLRPATARRGRAMPKRARDRARRCGRSRRSVRWSARCGTSRSGRWMVTGTTAARATTASSPARTACRSLPRRACARNSVWPGSAKPER